MLKKLLLLGLITCNLSATAQRTCPSWGPYITSANFSTGGELDYTEVMAPSAGLPIYFYWSTINFYVGPRGGYCGIQTTGNGTRQCIFSIWDMVDDNTAHECYSEYAVPGSVVEGFGNEGTGIHAILPINWTPDYWYTTAVRRWSTGDNKTRVGFFMYHYSTGKWYHYFTFVTPEQNAKLANGMAGFLENYGGSANNLATGTGYYRNSWTMDSTGQFSKPQYYDASAGTGSWSAQSALDNTALKVTSCGTTPTPAPYPPFFLNQGGTKPAPAIPANITSVVPTYANSHINVTWAINEYCSPQLSYTVSIHGSGGLYTPPVAVVQGIRPDTRNITCALPAGSPTGTYWVSVQVIDIFNQTSNLGYASVNVNSVPVAGINTNIYYKLRNISSGLYLDIEGASIQNGAIINQQYSNSSTSQQWKFTSIGGNYMLVNRKSGKVVDIASSIQNTGTNPILFQANSGVNQQWQMVPGNDGSYQIKSVLSQHLVIDDPGSSAANGTRMILYPPYTPASYNQSWILEPYSNTLNTQAYVGPDAFNQESEQVQAYPNPIDKGGMIKFNVPASEGMYRLAVKTVTGANVTNTEINASYPEVSTKDLAPGVYLFQITGNEKSYNGKFIVQ